jgi:signal transduction histidine kinase
LGRCYKSPRCCLGCSPQGNLGSVARTRTAGGEPTAALQIEQRKTAEAALEQLQLLEAIGQITSGVAHDFNNLLSVVLTNPRMLSSNPRDPRDREGVELIRTTACVKLTAQSLAFSRKQRLEPQEVDLTTEMVGMSALLGATLGGTVQLRTALAADLCPALVDSTQIESIILNLVINGRDAMTSGGVLTLETFNTVIDSRSSKPEEPVAGPYVGLAINDTGVGIPDDVFPRSSNLSSPPKNRGKVRASDLRKSLGSPSNRVEV